MRSSRSCLALRSSLSLSRERFCGRFSIIEAPQRPHAPAPYGPLAGFLRSCPNHFRILADKLCVTCIRHLTSAALGAVASEVNAEREAREEQMVAAREWSLPTNLGTRGPRSEARRRSRLMELALLPEPRPKARNLPTRYKCARRRSPGEQDSTCRASFCCLEQALNRVDGSESP